MKGEGQRTCSVVSRWDDGFSWMAFPEETFERSSHALVDDDGGVWLIDPLDAPGLDAELASLGTVRGVVVLSAYHGRDADPLASRFEVPVYLPRGLGRVADGIDAPVERVAGELGNTGFQCRPVGNELWSEALLYHPGRKTLVTGDVLTTAAHHTNGSRDLSVVPFLQLFPPRAAVEGLEVDRIIVGHGEDVTENAQNALERAVTISRREALQNVVSDLPRLLKIAYAATRH